MCADFVQIKIYRFCVKIIKCIDLPAELLQLKSPQYGPYYKQMSMLINKN